MYFEIQVNEKLFLKLRHKEDAEAIFLLVDKHREYLRPWFPWVETTRTTEDVEKYILGEHENFEKKIGADFGIWYEGGWIGSTGYHAISATNKKAAIGYWLAEDFTGKGIMTECVDALIRYGFKELRLNRIEIECFTTNTKSKAIAEKFGFTLEGVLRQSHVVNGVAADNCMYSLLKEEWMDL